MALPFGDIYKRTSAGKIQTWNIEVDGNKYRTISGQQDGEKVFSEWTIAKPKNVGKANETTGEQQALLEATARRTKKLEKDYMASIETVDETEFFKCMLAEDYNEVLKKDGKIKKKGDRRFDVTFPVYEQPKLDGLRCLAMKDGLWSRGGKPWVAVKHVHEQLAQFFITYPGMVIDGELYTDKLKNNFDEICSVFKQPKPTQEDFDKCAAVGEYWIYDIFNPDDPEWTFRGRHEFLTAAFKNILNKPSLVLVPTTLVNDKDDLDKKFEDHIEAGKEGQMIRDLTGKYDQRRSQFLLKRKDFIDEDFVLDYLEEGDGNYTGCAKTWHFYKDKKPFAAGVRGSRDVLRKWLEQASELKGCVCTVRYTNLTPDGVPRCGVVTHVNRKGY